MLVPSAAAPWPADVNRSHDSVWTLWDQPCGPKSMLTPTCTSRRRVSCQKWLYTSGLTRASPSPAAAHNRVAVSGSGLYFCLSASGGRQLQQKTDN